MWKRLDYWLTKRRLIKLGFPNDYAKIVAEAVVYKAYREGGA